MGMNANLYQMTCPNCGKELRPSDKFCPGCAMPNPYYIPNTNDNSNPFTNQQQNKNNPYGYNNQPQNYGPRPYSNQQQYNGASGYTNPNEFYTYGNENQYTNPNMQGPKHRPKNPSGNSGPEATLSLILSIGAIIFAFAQPIIGIILVIAGIVLGIAAKKKFQDKPKVTTALVICIIALFISIIDATGRYGKNGTDVSTTDQSEEKRDDTANTDSTDEAADTDSADTASTEDGTTDAAPNDVTFDTSAGMEKFQSGEYNYITTDDLFKYAANLQGQKIYTVITVQQKNDDENALQADIGDNYMFTNFKVVDGSFSAIPENTQVAILGEVDEMTDFKITTSINVKDCYVFAYGDDAAQYNQEKSADALSSYLVATEATANANGDKNLTEDEYKGLCQSYSAEEVMRNPDSYKDKYCVVSGKVDQIVEGALGIYTSIYVVDKSGQKWECDYHYKDGESHVLEGDSVTIYGKLDGTTTATTVLGKQVTLPYMSAKYFGN